MSTFSVGMHIPSEVYMSVDTSKLFKRCALPGGFIYVEKDRLFKQVCIKRVMYSNPATIVFWDDGTKTISKCFKDDKYNPETGLVMCILKKLYGGAKVKDVVDAWLPKNVEYKEGIAIHKNLHDVRKEANNK